LKEAREKKQLTEGMRNTIQRFTARRARANYIAHLILKEVSSRKSVADRSRSGVI